MELQTLIQNLKEDVNFKAWHKQHADYFLATAFFMIHELKREPWQIGYYNPKQKKMVIFTPSEESWQHSGEQEILKSKEEIELLNIEKVTLSIEDALQQGEECLQEYPSQRSTQQLFIVQQKKEETLFNITFFTQSLKTINVKMDAQTGKILQHSLQDLMKVL